MHLLILIFAKGLSTLAILALGSNSLPALENPGTGDGDKSGMNMLNMNIHILNIHNQGDYIDLKMRVRFKFRIMNLTEWIPIKEILSEVLC